MFFGVVNIRSLLHSDILSTCVCLTKSMHACYETTNEMYVPKYNWKRNVSSLQEEMPFDF